MTAFAFLFVEIIHPLSMDSPCERCQQATSSVMDANLFLFQTVVVGDNWGEVAIPVINRSPPSVWLIVGAYLSIAFGLLNLIIAVVDAKPGLRGVKFPNVVAKGPPRDLTCQRTTHCL